MVTVYVEVCAKCLRLPMAQPFRPCCGPAADMPDWIELECEGKGYTPGTPGRLWGPPEHCYPPEGPEFAEGITVKRPDGTEVPWDDLEESVQSEIEEALLVRAEDQEPEEREEREPMEVEW